ncbi:hypothetical protein TNCV_4588151 [Trichonephila clavipes]|nr:hypothetical protein TNCV_4588151 [Trichonephila clavipes]
MKVSVSETNEKNPVKGGQQKRRTNQGIRKAWPKIILALTLVRARRRTYPVTIFGQPVPWVNVAKYLGLFLDAKLTLRIISNRRAKKRSLFMPCLKGLSSRRSKLAIRHKSLLYKSIIRPVMCYGSQILDPPACHLKKLHTLTNSFLRQIVNAWFIRNEVIYRDLKIKPFLPHIKDLSKGSSINFLPFPMNYSQPACIYPCSAILKKRPRALLEHEFINSFRVQI